MIIRNRREKETVAIELTPMIDMVFLLLIFFLVATTFHQEEREMQIALPYASAAGPISTTLREMIINVTQDGELILNGRTITEDQLRQRIEEAVETNPEQKVSVRGDRDAAYQHVYSVLDICKHAGVQEPYLDAILE